MISPEFSDAVTDTEIFKIINLRSSLVLPLNLKQSGDYLNQGLVFSVLYSKKQPFCWK